MTQVFAGVDEPLVLDTVAPGPHGLLHMLVPLIIAVLAFAGQFRAAILVFFVVLLAGVAYQAWSFAHHA